MTQTRKALSWTAVAALLAAPWLVLAEEKTEEKISPYKQELLEKEKEYEALVERLRKEAPKYASLQFPQPKGPEEVTEVVLTDEKTALVQYLVGDKIAVAFVLQRPKVSADGKEEVPNLSVVKLDQEKVVAAARAFHAAISNPLSLDYREKGRALYDLVFAPVEGFLSGKTNLFLVPDGPLFYVPFEALTDQSGKYLIDRFSFTYAPSSSVLVEILEEQRQKRAQAASGTKRALLGVGDPIFSLAELQAPGEAPAERGAAPAEPEKAEEGEAEGEEGEGDGLDSLLSGELLTTRSLYEGRGYEFARLPYTGVEVQEIASLYSKSADVLLRDAAREEAIKQKDLTKYRIIHFATHGVVDEDFPQRSGVVLSLVNPDGTKDEDGEDGFLQMSEIFNLRLDADLVTLSACQTGLGKNVRGEGMVGIQRAFLYAGTPSVLVSLWNVNDLTTAHLMRAFYGNLDKGMNKTEALRKARRDMAAKQIDIGPLKARLSEREAAEAKERGFGEIVPMKTAKKGMRVDASHPYFWAAFVLVGSPD